MSKQMLELADYLQGHADRLTGLLDREEWTAKRSHIEGDRNAFVSAANTARQLARSSAVSASTYDLLQRLRDYLDINHKPGNDLGPRFSAEITAALRNEPQASAGNVDASYDDILTSWAECRSLLSSERRRSDDANAACLELATKHGFATGHGDTIADMIREFSAQIPAAHPRSVDTVEAILRRNFYTGEPGDIETIKQAVSELHSARTVNVPQASAVSEPPVSGNYPMFECPECGGDLAEEGHQPTCTGSWRMPTEPKSAPVAWRWRINGNYWSVSARDPGPDVEGVEPLYTHSQAGSVERLTDKIDEQTTALDQIMTTAADNLAAPGSDLKMTLEFIHHVAEYTLSLTRPQRGDAGK
jgi:hypothetical protein